MQKRLSFLVDKSQARWEFCTEAWELDLSIWSDAWKVRMKYHENLSFWPILRDGFFHGHQKARYDLGAASFLYFCWPNCPLYSMDLCILILQFFWNRSTGNPSPPSLATTCCCHTCHCLTSLNAWCSLDPQEKSWEKVVKDRPSFQGKNIRLLAARCEVWLSLWWSCHWLLPGRHFEDRGWFAGDLPCFDAVLSLRVTVLTRSFWMRKNTTTTTTTSSSPPSS